MLQRTFTRQQGRKAFMIRIIKPLDSPDPSLERVAKANGLSLHAGVSCEGHQKEKVRAGTVREAALIEGLDTRQYL